MLRWPAWTAHETVKNRRGRSTGSVALRWAGMGEVSRDPNAFRAASGEGALVVWADGSIAALNDAGAALLGHHASELVGRDVHEVAVELARGAVDPAARIDRPVTDVLASGVPRRDVLVTVVRAEGDRRTLMISCRPQLGHDHIVSVACTFTDVTASLDSGGHLVAADVLDAGDAFAADLSRLPAAEPFAAADSPWARRSA